MQLEKPHYIFGVFTGISQDFQKWPAPLPGLDRSLSSRSSRSLPQWPQASLPCFIALANDTGRERRSRGDPRLLSLWHLPYGVKTTLKMRSEDM